MHDFVVQEPEDEPAEGFDLALANEVVAGLIVVFMDWVYEARDPPILSRLALLP